MKCFCLFETTLYKEQKKKNTLYILIFTVTPIGERVLLCVHVCACVSSGEIFPLRWPSLEQPSQAALAP